MEILLVTFGKTHAAYLREGIDEYIGRLRHYLTFRYIELPDVMKKGRTADPQRQKELEGDALLAEVKNDDRLILLDERGTQLTSEDFAAVLQRRMASGLRRLVFVIGGPYGFCSRVYDRADALLSLSKMTFSHEMVRLFAVEQIYRAMTILRSEPYHHR